MKTVNFTAGWFWFYCGEFVAPVSYTIGSGTPIEVQVDENGENQNRMFIRGARNLAANPSQFPEARANLVTDTGAPMLAKVLSASSDNPCRIVLEVDENIQWVDDLED